MARRSSCTIRVSLDQGARRIATGVAQATHWPTETWAVHPIDNPGASTNQFTLYKHEGRWYPWTGSIVRFKDKQLAMKLALKRRQNRSCR